MPTAVATAARGRAARVIRRRVLALGGVAVLSAGCTPVLPAAPPRASAWGPSEAAAGAPADVTLPSTTTMCRDVFAAALAELDAERIYVDSPTSACMPVVRELARRPGIQKWRSRDRAEQAMQCPGRCGPRNGVLVTLTYEHAGCFHAAARVATGGSFSMLCWEHGTIVTRGPIGVW